ncbi:MAG: zf-HC2 domain-containing protein, partial [Candidatus Zixiibacteriota bacterium]
MHPSRQQLGRYLDGLLDDATASQIRRHLDQCELCRELCENEQLLNRYVAEAAGESLPKNAHELADRLYRAALAGAIIDLQPLTTEDSRSQLPVRLAADGKTEFRPPVQNLATLYSENPEVVLQLARDV